MKKNNKKNTLLFQVVGHIKLNKSDSQDIYNVTKEFYIK